MFLIDRYIAWTFTKVVLVALVSLAGLYVVVDAMNNLEELLTYAKSQPGGALRVLVDYYGPRVLVLFDRTAGLLATVAAMLTITLLQRSQELTALMAAGVSKVRIAAPVLASAVVVTALGVANREWMLPQVRERLAYNAQDLSGQYGRAVTPRYDNHTLFMFSGAKAYPKLRCFDAPQIRLSAEFSSWGQKIQADKGYFLPADEKHPAGYLLQGVSTPTDLTELPLAMLEKAPVLIGPKDAAWLKPNECFVASGLSFEQLTGDTTFRHYFSTLELVRGLGNKSLDFGNDAKVIVHVRLLTPLLDFTVLLLGLPLVLGRENRKIYVAVGVCAVLVAALLAVTMASHAAGTNFLLRPSLAAWLPLMIFAPAAYALARPLWD